MLRAVLGYLSSTAAGLAMTEMDAVACAHAPVPGCGPVPGQASSLIASSTKRPDKRRAEGAPAAAAGPKRPRAADSAGPASSDLSHDDQENVQQQQQQRRPAVHQHQHPRCAGLVVATTPAGDAAPTGGAQPAKQAAPRGGGLGAMMLGPLYGWLQQQGGAAAPPPPPQQQLPECGGGGGPLSPRGEQRARLQQQQQQQSGDSSVDCTSTPSSSAAPSASGAATISSRGVVGGAAAHQHQHHQQFLQQEGQLYAQHAAAAAHHAADGSGSQQGACCSSGGGSDESDELDYDEEDFDPLAFIGSLGPVEQYAPPGRQPLLPRQTRQCKQKTLVLDLDETLVHSTLDAACCAGADFSFPVVFNGGEHMVHVRQRPHMRAFLERVAALFEVVVFTASQKVYAEKLLNILDPQRQLIRHRIYRDSCVLVDGNYLKDLSVLGRDLSRCAIVDNSPQAFGFQVANGIPIESWYDDPEDTELLALLPFLEDIASACVADVRPAISSRFNLPAKVHEASMRLVCAAAAAAAAGQGHQQQQAQAVAAAAAAATRAAQAAVAAACSDVDADGDQDGDGGAAAHGAVAPQQPSIVVRAAAVAAAVLQPQHHLATGGQLQQVLHHPQSQVRQEA